MLTLGRADDQTFQFRPDLDLARQPAGRFDILREVEHGFFHVGLGRNLFDPSRIDIDMAGGAGAGAAAIGIDSGYEFFTAPSITDQPSGTSTSRSFPV